MSADKEYFSIDKKFLGDPETEPLFPFHLYVYNPASGQYSTYLHANSPLIRDKRLFLEEIIDKGGEVAVSMDQKRTFLVHEDVKEEDVESLQEEPVHELVAKREKMIKELEEREAQGKFHFKKEFKDATANKEGSFQILIDQARLEIQTLSVTRSHTVSLATYLAENLLIEDNFINRIVAFAYHLAKGCGMDDDQAIGDLVCAAYLSHLGQTQIDFEYSHIPQLKMNGLQQKEFRKHPALSQHLIRKSGLLVSERCNQIITQHHERFDGNGYPDSKKGDHIEPLGLILGAAAHILEFQTGRVTGTEVTMRTIINCFKNDAPMTGLELEFGKVIYDNLLNMFEDENLSESKGPEDEVQETKQAA